MPDPTPTPKVDEWASPQALHLRAAAGPGYAGEWAVFCDYTAATDQPTLPTTTAALTGFLDALPARPATLRRRVRAIAAAHRRTGYLLARPAAGPAAPASAPAPRRADPSLMIAASPTRGWPHGLTGRRDSFLIVLTEVLHLPHDAARALQAADIAAATGPEGGPGLTIDGHPVPTDDDPRTCPACAVVRWLDILGDADGLGRGSARTTLTAAHAPTTTSSHQHQHRPTAPERWRAAAVLLPAVDRHGWHDDYHPMTSRSIRARLAHAAARASTGASPQDEPVPTEANGPIATEPPRPTPGLHEVLTLLDDVADDADTLNTRIQALLDEHGHGRGSRSIHGSAGTPAETRR